MRNKVLLFSLAFLLAFLLSAFAGEGSDTVGDENLLPQLRYSYSENDYRSKWANPVGRSEEFNFSDHSVFLQLDYGITDNVDIYGLLGYRNLDAEMLHQPGMGTLDALLWGVGLKATFYRMDNGLYFGGGLGVTHAFTPRKQQLHLYTERGDFDYNELNVTADLHVGWTFEKIGLTPYVGAEYRYTQLMLENIDPTNAGDGTIDDEDTGLFYDDHNFGMYVGLDYYIKNRFYVNVEGHFFNYTGVSGSVGYLFDAAIPNLSSGVASDTIGACNLLPQVRYSYIYNDFDTDYEGFVDDASHNDFNIENHSVYFQLTYGLTDYVDVYGLIGHRKINFDFDGLSRITGDINALLWGAGLKATFYRAENGFFVGGGLGLTHAFNPQRQQLNNNNDTSYSVRYKEMNLTADLRAGWHFKKIRLTPYVGVEYRYTWATLEEYDSRFSIDEDESARFTQKDYVGVFAGLDWFITDRLFFNIEGHAIDYYGGSAGIGYRFDICGRPEAVAPAPAPVIEPKLEPMSKN
jgi:outer membrane protein W